MLELQITYTKHPKSVADEQTDRRMNKWINGRSEPITRPDFAKVTQVMIFQESMAVYSSMRLN